ncbi:MAG: efflux RND transporter periplasmic adaptor subunit [bacterium]
MKKLTKKQNGFIYLGWVVFFYLNSYAVAWALDTKGRLEWLHQTDMRVLVDGVVDQVNVIVGQTVKKGEVVLQLDQREFKAAVEEAKAQLSYTKLQTATVEREYERVRALFERGLASIEDEKGIELALAQAKSALATAKMQLTQAEIALQRTQLIAPFDGLVIAQRAWAGDIIYKTLQKDALISIAPYKKMLARALVPVTILQRYKKGQTIHLTVRNQRYTGKVYQLGVEAVRIEPEGAIYELDVSFQPTLNGSSLRLRPTETVTLHLP